MPGMIVGVYGSARAGGNTDYLLDAVLEQVDEQKSTVHRVYARELAVEGCRACGGCDHTGRCVVRDEMQSVYPLLVNADALIVAVPIYFYGVPAQLKALIDRCQACYNMRRLDRAAYPPGYGHLIAVGATKGRRLFDGIRLTMRYFFDAIGKDYGQELLARAIDEAGSVRAHADIVAAARELGRTIQQTRREHDEV